MRFLKRFLSFELKIRILLFLLNFRKNPFFRKEDIGSGRKIFIFLVADYGNLGDVAISYAQSEFIRRYFPTLEIVEVPISQTVEGLHFTKKYIQPNDLVATNGGGNFGSLYPDIETLRRLVIESFPNNRIVSFPQTIDFTNDKEGRNALKLAQITYSAHRNLVLAAREERSFLAMKELFPSSKVVLSPDIVMSLNKVEPKKERRGLVICLRDDKEKNLTTDQVGILYSLISKYFDLTVTYDTHIGRGNLTADERLNELSKIWDAFRMAEMVVTDRLHGMIFSYITATPCLVFLNNNYKIQDCYNWIKACSNVHLVTSFSEHEIENKISFLRNTHFPSDPLNISVEFEDFVKSFKIK